METNVGAERRRFVTEFATGAWSMTELCERYGISRPTGYKWVARYAAGVPATIAYPEMTLSAAFADAAARFANRPAVSFLGTRLTYRELAGLVARFANRLRQLGLRPGDRVLLLLPNCPQFLIAHFGTLAAGGIVAPLSPLLVEREIEALAREAGARIAVVLDLVYGKIVGLQRRGDSAGIREFLRHHSHTLLPAPARHGSRRAQCAQSGGATDPRRKYRAGRLRARLRGANGE